jgi:hypothetical protein
MPSGSVQAWIRKSLRGAFTLGGVAWATCWNGFGLVQQAAEWQPGSVMSRWPRRLGVSAMLAGAALLRSIRRFPKDNCVPVNFHQRISS